MFIIGGYPLLFDFYFVLCAKTDRLYFSFRAPLFVKHALFVYQNKSPLQLRPMLAQMSLLALLINLLFSLGLLIS